LHGLLYLKDADGIFLKNVHNQIHDCTMPYPERLHSTVCVEEGLLQMEAEVSSVTLVTT
jgi:hypothetical protein